MDEDGKADCLDSLRMRRKERKGEGEGEGDEHRFIDRQVTAEMVMVVIHSPGTVAVNAVQPLAGNSWQHWHKLFLTIGSTNQ